VVYIFGLHCNRLLSEWPIIFVGWRRGRQPVQLDPPLEYRQTPVSTAANGSLSFAEQRRLEEYNREREAMEAATSVKGNLPSEDKGKQNSEIDPLQAIQAALINARSALGANPAQGGLPQPVSSQLAGAGPQEQRTEYERQNDQQQKAGFGQQHGKQESDYLNSARKPAWASLKLRLAGSFQPCWNSSSTPICRG